MTRSSVRFAKFGLLFAWWGTAASAAFAQILMGNADFELGNVPSASTSKSTTRPTCPR